MSRAETNIANLPGKGDWEIFSRISIWVAVIIAICSVQPWPVWNNNPAMYLSVLLFLFRLPLLIGHTHLSKRLPVAIVILVVYGLLYCQPGRILPYTSFVSFFTKIVPLLLVVLFDPDEQKLFLRYFITTFAVIICVSFPFYLCHIFGFNLLPSTYLRHPNPFYTVFDNYKLFVIMSDLGVFTRFSSIYAEPGHLGMISALLMYVTGYNVKHWRTDALGIAVIASFSLAGYVLMVLGFFLHMIATSRNMTLIVARFAGLLVVMVAGYLYIENQASNSHLAQAIVNRLEFDKDKGISGNNRNTDKFESMYKQFLKSDDVWLGENGDRVGKLLYGTENSSYKIAIIQNGYVCLALLFLFALAMVMAYPSRLGWGMLLLIVISFWQRPYFLWGSQCFTYVSALTLFYYRRFGPVVLFRDE